MKIAIYSRKSRITNIGDSIENQINLCKDYCKNKIVDEIFIYEDEGFSGKNTERPEFKKMLEDARCHKFNSIVCYRLDRISRNLYDFTNIINELDTLNIQFVSIKEQFDTSSPMGKAMMYIASIFAQLERETTAQRVSDNMLQLAKSGQWLGGQTPLGYKSQCKTFYENSKINKKIYVLSPIESEITTIRLIYDLYDKKRSLNKVKDFLNENLIPAKSNINWTAKRVQVILRSPVYVKSSPDVLNYLDSNNINVFGSTKGNGILIYNKTKNITQKRDRSEWIASISDHKGIIDSAKWLQIQNILDTNAKRPPSKGTSNRALLVGILKCANCNGNMYIKHGHISANSNNRILYYVCENKSKSKGKLCDNGNVRVDEIETIVMENINRISIDTSKFIEALFNTMKVKDYSLYSLNVNKQIQYKNIKIQNLLDELSSSPELSKHIKPKILELEDSINNLKDKKLSRSFYLKNNYLLKLFSKEELNISLFEDYITLEEKKYILRELIESIYFNEKSHSLEINYK